MSEKSKEVRDLEIRLRGVEEHNTYLLQRLKDIINADLWSRVKYMATGDAYHMVKERNDV